LRLPWPWQISQLQCTSPYSLLHSHLKPDGSSLRISTHQQRLIRCRGFGCCVRLWLARYSLLNFATKTLLLHLWHTFTMRSQDAMLVGGLSVGRLTIVAIAQSWGGQNVNPSSLRDSVQHADLIVCHHPRQRTRLGGVGSDAESNPQEASPWTASQLQHIHCGDHQQEQHLLCIIRFG